MKFSPHAYVEMTPTPEEFERLLEIAKKHRLVSFSCGPISAVLSKQGSAAGASPTKPEIQLTEEQKAKAYDELLYFSAGG